MKVGEKGIIVKIRVKGEMNRRLRDMGLVPGTQIKVQGRAPLYDPVNIKIRGNNLSLRNNEADYIQVEVDQQNKGEKE
jgi:ferrous iron transport protein A